jgi:hypothetical protein
LNYIKKERQLSLDKYNFLKIKDDFYIQYEGEIFDLHKPSDIRSLCYLLNREKGFSELECEYNGEYK